MPDALVTLASVFTLKNMELQNRIGQQRIQHIIDSYILMGEEVSAFESYLSDLLGQYPHGLIELALVETLVRNWLTIPMVKGVPFLANAHERLQAWQQDQWQQLTGSLKLTPNQFSQITGLDAQIAWDAIALQTGSAIARLTALPVSQATAESV